VRSARGSCPRAGRGLERRAGLQVRREEVPDDDRGGLVDGQLAVDEPVDGFGVVGSSVSGL
jgi:hypothetical protein